MFKTRIKPAKHCKECYKILGHHNKSGLCAFHATKEARKRNKMRGEK